MRHKTILFLTLFVAASCGGDESAFKADKEALAEASRISQRVSRGGVISEKDLTSLRSIHERYPDSLSVRTVLKDVLISREDWEAVMLLIEAVPEGERSDAESLELGRVLIKLGDFKRAAAVLEGLKDFDPSERAVLLARAYFESSDYDRAGEVLDSQWPQIASSKSVDAITIRGLVYFHKGHLEKARSTLEEAIALDPDTIAANNALSRVHSALNEPDKAAEYAEKVRALFKRITDDSRSKTLIVTKLNLVREAYDSKDYERVISLAKETLPLVDPANRIALYDFMHSSYTALGMKNEAEAIRKKASEEMRR